MRRILSAKLLKCRNEVERQNDDWLVCNRCSSAGAWLYPGDISAFFLSTQEVDRGGMSSLLAVVKLDYFVRKLVGAEPPIVMRSIHRSGRPRWQLV
jgi:hypothetical protein